MRANFLTFAMSFLQLCPSVTIAVNDGEKVAEKSLQPSLSSMALIETLGGLALILLLIFGLGWLLRRFGRLPLKGNAMISIIGGVSLGSRERAVLLQVEGTRLLIGVAPGRVQTLHHFNNDPVKPGPASIDKD